jgi:hypothetical protein
MFPGGVAVESRDWEQAIRATRELIVNPEIQAIFEGAFEHRDVFVRVDVLQRRRDRRWRLVEVKSTADVRDHHLNDVAIQYRTVKGSGVDVASSCLAHVNRSYVFSGSTIDARRFFRVRSLTRRVERLQPKLTFLLRSEFRVLAMPKAPEVAPGRQCVEPVTCEFFGLCNPPLPDDHVARLPRINGRVLEEFEEMGIESIRDIPEDFDLSEIQRRACTAVQTGQPYYSTELAKELRTLKYPLYFMDFETVNPAIPRFPGMRPFDQIPFQWSVHVQREPGAQPEHYEFLATNKSDPRREFIASLCAVLGDSGSVVVYHQPFEEQRLSDLAAWLPEFAGRIKRIQRRLWDLLPIMRNHVYHPAFAGSFSLKAVLPALVPDLSYEGMAVANGQDAGLAWESLVRSGLEEAERLKTEKALREYCGQDTLAMVRLLEKLRVSH